MSSQTENQFIFRCTTEARDFLLREGTDVKYGARHLKRAIERHLVFPLSNLIATGQIGVGDVIKIDMGRSGEKLAFTKERIMSSLAASEEGGLPGISSRRPTKGDSKAAGGLK